MRVPLEEEVVKEMEWRMFLLVGQESTLFFLVVGDACQDSGLDLQINIIFSTPLQNPVLFFKRGRKEKKEGKSPFPRNLRGKFNRILQ